MPVSFPNSTVDIFINSGAADYTSNVNVNVTASWDPSALEEALEAEDMERVKAIADGFEGHSHSPDLWRPLAKYGSPDACRLLVSKESSDRIPNWVLHEAAVARNWPLVSYLSQILFDLPIRALGFFAAQGDVESLQEADSFLGFTGKEDVLLRLLQEACKAGQTDVVRLYIDLTFEDPTMLGPPRRIAPVDLNSLLLSALVRGNVEIVKVLLDGGASVHGHHVCNAVAYGYAEILAVLLNHDPSEAKPALYTAASRGDAASFQQLLDAGVEPNEDTLCEVMQCKETTWFTRLLEKVPLSKTVLMEACRGGRVDILRVILESDFEWDRQDQSYTAQAIRHNHPKTLALLLEHGALLSETAHQGVSEGPLLEVIRNTFPTMWDHLIND